MIKNSHIHIHKCVIRNIKEDTCVLKFHIFQLSFYCEFKCFCRIVILFLETLRIDFQAFWEKNCVIVLYSPNDYSLPFCRCGARMWKKFCHHLLLVQRSTEYLQFHFWKWGLKLEDDHLLAGFLGHGLLGYDQRHSVFWKSQYVKSPSWFCNLCGQTARSTSFWLLTLRKGKK